MAAEVKSCSVEICNNPAFARGYCGAHYQRMRRHGDPLAGGTWSGDPMWFIHEVALHHTGDECLTWPFSTNNGYGQIRIDGTMVLATRYVCELVNGPPPTPEHHAAHSCGKGHESCISPIHLDWKTPAENKADELLHGTRNRGERNGQAKITEPEAREILALQGKETRRYLSERFGVSPRTILQIHKGERWGWLSDCRSQAVANRAQIR
jgi:hypothetical protein